MQIEELTLQTGHLTDQKTFYRSTLGFPQLEETATSFTVQAGRTRLRFEETSHDVRYHFTFTIPRNTLLQAKEWLLKRVPLLCTKEGEDVVHFPTIHARSLYFFDAANHILEFMAHDDLSQEREGPFGAASVLTVSEIGLPVEDVRAFSSQLKEQIEIGPYPGSRPISEDFAYLGDLSGQFVVVKAGRPWFPTETIRAAAFPVQLTISGPRAQQIWLSPYPYLITVTTV